MITVVGKVDYKALHLIIECIKTHKPVMFCVEHNNMFYGIERLLQANGCDTGKLDCVKSRPDDKIIFVNQWGGYGRLSDEEADKVLDSTPDIVLIKNITKEERTSFGSLIEHVFEFIDINQNLVKLSFYSDSLESACNTVYNLLELRVITGFVKPKVFMPYKKNYFGLEDTNFPIKKYFCPFNVTNVKENKHENSIDYVSNGCVSNSVSRGH